MYAILVKEPGAETETYVLPTGASTPKSATELMFSRAEEYISEKLELNVEGAEDYLAARKDHLIVEVFDTTKPGNAPLISFEATAIAEVV